MNSFGDVIGQKQTVDHLRNAIRYGKISNAYLICGERRCGKQFIADIFAAALECEETEKDPEHNTDPCGRCHSCVQAATKNQPDIIYVTHTEKSNLISVDDIREQVNHTVAIKPYSSRYKIYIMNEAEKMNQAAQNALLKTIEEPPEYAVFLLLTSNVSALLPTILSRCVTLQMKPVSDGEVRGYLKKKNIQGSKADMCVAFARGNIGKAMFLATNERFDSIIEDSSALMDSIGSIDQTEIDNAVRSIKKYFDKTDKNVDDQNDADIDINDYLDIIAVWYRDALLYKASNDTNHLIFKNGERLNVVMKIADHASYEGIEQVLNAIDRTKTRIAANVNFELALELLFLTIRDNS